MRTAIFSANFESLDAIREFAAQAARDAGMDDASIYAVELSTDEACSNIIEHAYEGETGGKIEITCDRSAHNLVIILRDHGKTFDPTSVSSPDLDADLSERQVGGLGVFLMKKLMDEVHFEALGELGNVLTLVKHIPRPVKKKTTLQPKGWKWVIQLGEELMQAGSLVEKGDLIIRTAESVLQGKAELWLDESHFRLPGIEPSGAFTTEPTSETMREVIKRGKDLLPDRGKDLRAVALKHNSLVLGVLQVEKQIAPFKKKEIDLLDGMAAIISLALVAAHRSAVEQWRIEQLTLVRRVSAQVANLFDVGELTRRITKLIQRTFHYYYVAIFTTGAGNDELTFRASAGPQRGGGKRVSVRRGEGMVGNTALTGRETVSNDVRSEARFKFIDILANTQSEAALPLKIEDRVLGVLDVQSDQLEAFHPNDLLVLRALADTVAIAINSARLFTELQTRINHLAVVAKVSETVTTTLELEELLNKVAGLIQDSLKISQVHLFSVHLTRRQIIFEAGSDSRSAAHKGHVLNLDTDEGIIAWVAKQGQTLVVNDLRQEHRFSHTAILPQDSLSEMTIPLVFRDQVIGILDLQSDRKAAFNDELRFLCEALADSIAAAIRNADLYRTERWRRQVADSLHEVAGLISEETNLDNVLDSVLRELERNLPIEVAAIWLMEGEHLYPAQAHGVDILELDEVSSRWPEAHQFLISSLALDEPLVRKPDDPIGPAGVALGFSADYSSIITALRTGDRPLGVLTLSHHSSGRYGHEAQAITATFANYAAAAIENARLFDAAQEQAYASAALLQVAQAVSNSSSLDETLGSIVRITPILVGVTACGFFLTGADGYTTCQNYGFPENTQAYLKDRQFKSGEFPLLDQVREKGQLVVGILPGGFTEDRLDPELALTEQETFYALQNGEHLLIGMPLTIKNDFYGVMLVAEGPESRRFRQRRVEIITSVAQQAAMSIQNEHLQKEMVNRERLEQEIQLARKIQKTFLPETLPSPAGWDLAATWITARQVGGDFYDVFDLPGKKLGLFIADVSDKGVPAALFMALTRTLVRAIVFDTPSPADALQRVNALILPENINEMFVTVIYGVLELEKGRLTYVNAGHNPPLWFRRSSGRLEWLTRTGAALGIIDQLKLEEETILLEKDDLLLMYTDGVTEAFSPQDETFGEDRLKAGLSQVGSTDMRSALDSLEGLVKRFMGQRPPEDDLTMLGIKRTA